jgi:hypothetical protein
MKKIIIFLSLLLTTIYLSSAVNISLNSWSKLEGSSWDNLSSVLNKVDVSWSELKVNWKLAVNWKICLADNNCMGECEEHHNWDVSTSSCVPEWGWNDEYTVLLLDFDSDTNDSSSKNQSITKVWNANVSSTRSKFWWKSLYLDWTWDYLDITDSGDFVFGTWDFTIDLRVYMETSPDNWDTLISRVGELHWYWGWWLTWWMDRNAWLRFYPPFRAYWGAAAKEIWPTVVWLNAWHHVAVVKSGSIISMYVDWTLKSSWTQTVAFDRWPHIRIWWQVWAWNFKWYLDEIRISKWIARWTTDFTVPTWPYN